MKITLSSSLSSVGPQRRQKKYSFKVAASALLGLTFLLLLWLVFFLTWTFRRSNGSIRDSGISTDRSRARVDRNDDWNVPAFKASWHSTKLNRAKLTPTAKKRSPRQTLRTASTFTGIRKSTASKRLLPPPPPPPPPPPASIIEFEHQPGAVIVTKIHGPHQLKLLQQSICLLHAAYNYRVLYDIVVFTTLPVPEEEEVGESEDILKRIRSMVTPASFTIVVDTEGIVQQVKELSPERRQAFLDRCNATSPEQITWDTKCREPNSKAAYSQLAYNWQAEFRSWHIWTHPALHKYRYMMWIDTDAYCTRPWDRDPIALAMNQSMAIFFMNYPQGRAKIVQPRIYEAFGTYVCEAKLKRGHLDARLSDDNNNIHASCLGAQLWTVHGFFHVTSLDFFRQPKVLHWAETLIGDCFLCRSFDDQAAVTVPALVLAPDRSWDMYSLDVKLGIVHNNLIDGKNKQKTGGFFRYWNRQIKRKKVFERGQEQCKITEGN